MKQNENNQRQELFKTIWNIAEDLRNRVDGWDFKAYVLGFLFYRYLSEDFVKFANSLEPGSDFNYQDLDDNEITTAMKNRLIEWKGYYIAPSQLAQNVAKTNDDPSQLENFNETLATIFKAIENSSAAGGNNCLSGLFNEINLNGDKLGKQTLDRNQRLLKVLQRINELDLGDFDDNRIDIFGDAYEYLIRMYASNAGKSGGEFYTPQEVSELLFKLAIVNKKQIKTIYDPACGSGSLLLKATKMLDRKDDLKIYGQEVSVTPYNLARMNMFLHGIHYNNFDIKCDDTLVHPQHRDQKFDIIVSNPPYSTKWAGKNDPQLIADERFSIAGALAPTKAADFAFIMHILHHLQAGGNAAVVCFTGIMHRKGAEQNIRQYLVDHNYISAIIQLPPNIFYGTSISTVIMVLSKAKTDGKVVFIDAANEYQKVNKNNQLNQAHIDKIVDHYQNRKEVEHFAKVVTNEEIAANDYDLSVNRYVKKLIVREVIDIDQLEQDLESCLANINQLSNDIKAIAKQIRNGTFLKK